MSMKLGAASGTYNVQATESAKVSIRPSYKTVRCITHFLDGAEASFDIDRRAKGQDLLDKVFEHLELVEKDYFGLQFADVPQADGEDMKWLDAAKALRKQARVGPPFRFFFHVKFYVTDPSKLMEEYTRYHFFLQIKKDILDGKMVVPYKSAVLLASYAVQSELGDYCVDDHRDYYLSEFRFIPGQPESFEREVAEMHKQHRGLHPADAELRYLDHVRRLDTYGVDMHCATVRDGSVLDVNLGVSATGLVVFQNNIRINTFTWANLVKISFKRKQFFVQLRQQVNESMESTIGFDMISYRACKNLWKSCIEHHTFFRLHAPPVLKTSMFSLGSKFRYSGRTEFQAIEDSKKRAITGRTFVRSPSKRFARRTVGSSARDAILREMPLSNTVGDLRYPDSNVNLNRTGTMPNSTSYPMNMRNYANNNSTSAQQLQMHYNALTTRASLPPSQRHPGGQGHGQNNNGWTVNGGSGRWQQQPQQQQRNVPDSLTYATIAGDTVTRRSLVAGETRMEQRTQPSQAGPSLQQRASRLYESSQEVRTAPKATMEDLVHMASKPPPPGTYQPTPNDSEASYREKIAREARRMSGDGRQTASQSSLTKSNERVFNGSTDLLRQSSNVAQPVERIPTLQLHAEPRSATMVASEARLSAAAPPSMSNGDIRMSSVVPSLPAKTSSNHEHQNGHVGNGYNGHTVTNGHGPDTHGLVTIRMKPDAQGRFGFNVKGGADQNMPIIVSRVAPGTPADMCFPRLNEGDQVLYINGRDISQHSHEQVVQFIRSSRELHTGELVLLVRPNVYIGDDLPSEPEFQYVPDAHQVSASLPPGHDPLAGSMLVLRESVDSGAALAQFEQLFRKRHDMTTNAALTNENMAKNRYRDILPYDETRVRLRGSATGDYINASYVNMEVPGMGIINRYIAAQGPLPNTTADFWTMVWQQQCTLVIMLTTQVERGRVKCHQYWPNLNDTLPVGDTLRLTCTKEEDNGVIAYREFTLVHKEDIALERHIYHMQYIAWPDHGVPDDSRQFIDFVSRVRQNRTGMVEPTVVHCSAGIGRTGVLITMETAMCLIEANEPVYPLTLVRQMRDQRAMLIQTTGQYKFVCDAILRAYSEGIVQPLDEYKMR